MQVKLTCDLTKYHSSLTVGVIGEVLGPYGQWSSSFDRFILVRFPQVTLDILWANLEAVRPSSQPKRTNTLPFRFRV
jgi:hypothetical protein